MLVISDSRLDLFILFGLIRLIMYLVGKFNVMLVSVCVVLYCIFRFFNWVIGVVGIVRVMVINWLFWLVLLVRVVLYLVGFMLCLVVWF